MDFPIQVQYIAGLIVLIFLFFPNLWMGSHARKRSKRKEAPQPCVAFPILGHLHLLMRGGKPLFQVLGDMADAHGPVLMLRLGMRPTLVVSSWEAAKDCFTTNDKVLATRPSSAAGKHMGYDYAMFGFAPYGPYWRTVRKIAMSELLSNCRLDLLKHVRSMEIDACIKEMYQLWVDHNCSPVKVEMKNSIGDLAYNIVVNMVAGKRYFGSGGGSEEAWRFRRAVSQFFHLLGAFVASDLFPFLEGRIDLQGHERAMKSAFREMDSLMSRLLQEHHQRMLSQKGSGDHCDFMDVMLSVMEDSEFSKMDRDKIIKATSLALMIGGTDTTTTSLNLTLALLLLFNRGALKKAQDELDSHVGRERPVEESDLKHLVYLQAIVKEAFRLCPATPLSVPREAMEDCQIGGFHVPAGTRILVNVWKLQRDPGVWPDPCEFKPERFLAAAGNGKGSVDVRGQHWELIPFGAGRRSCPGMSFALAVMHLALARLIQAFELEVAQHDGLCGMSVDHVYERLLVMDPSKSFPLHIVLTPRLPAGLYA